MTHDTRDGRDETDRDETNDTDETLEWRVYELDGFGDRNRIGTVRAAGVTDAWDRARRRFGGPIELERTND